MFETITKLDFSILNGLREAIQCSFCDVFWQIISLLGEKGVFFIICALLMLCFKKTRRMGITVAIALISGLALGNGVIKHIVARPRPYTVAGYESIRQSLLIPELSDGSFPSGHALAAFEAAVSMMFYKKSFGVPALVLGALMCVSRVYLFVHYPSDVVAGAVFGSLFAVAAYCIVKLLYEKYDLEEKLTFKFERK